MKRRERRE
jgi:magnesium-transporting ATPase (P-type)